MNSNTPLLDRAKLPANLRQLDEADLVALADELRTELIDVVSKTGGHLGAGLGVVELTIALHYVFDTPHDKILWDVGHQTYPHKILTGRREAMLSLRKKGGLSGFTKRSESPYDVFGAGHSSTSISAALGISTANKLDGIDQNVVAVIGDGALSAGLAYEAMNNAAEHKNGLIVILNDNEMSIAPAVGAMSVYLSRLFSGKTYRALRRTTKRMLSKSNFLTAWIGKIEEHIKGFWTGGTLFEELGFTYFGLLDGHDVLQLVSILRNVKNFRNGKPALIHIRTRKGHGYKPAENSADKYHGVVNFDPATGKQNKGPTPAAPSYTSVFANSLIKEAQHDSNVCAITAAMPDGTGLNKFAELFPKRTFDVGIAEQHAVTFAAGMATCGKKPFVALYSTFLQRAYDQIVHDVAIQKLPVRFAIDRAGLVGADGATHVGAFDVASLLAVPNTMLMAAGDEADLARMVATAGEYNEGPCFFRYPRGAGCGATIPLDREILDIGKARVMCEGERIAILSYGGRLSEVMRAKELLAEDSVFPTVVDARFAKPLDLDLIMRLCESHDAVLTIEEGASGGFGSHVLVSLAEKGLCGVCSVRCMSLPDRWIGHGSMSEVYDDAKLSAPHIAECVKKMLTRNR